MPPRAISLKIFPPGLVPAHCGARSVAAWLALALAFTLAGCAPSDPMNAKISADDTTTFFRWKRDVGGDLPPQAQQQLENTLQELRFDVQFRQEASGHDAIEEAVVKKLNNLTVHDALLLGAQLKWRRLAGERADLQRVTNANAHLVTKPGDNAADAELEASRARQQSRLESDTAEQQAVEKEIVALGGTVPTTTPGVPETKPIATSHAEAQKQIADMIAGRRAGAATAYGAWPVKFDWDGKQLDEAKRAEFQKQAASAALQKRIVIAVRIKGRWLLYEGLNQAPALPDDVKAVLTPAEQAAFKHDWLEAEAENWAREVAKDFPDATPAPSEK